MSNVTLFDTNNLAMRCVHVGDVKTVNKSTKKVTNIDWDYWKYLMFSSIYKSIFTNKSTSIVTAIDDKKSWRYEIWKRYKEDRKKKKLNDTSEFPWDKFFVHYNGFMQDIKDHLPIIVLKQPRAEADDIIGVITGNEQQQCTIVSNDKDYLQCSCSRVKIYNPMKKMYISHPDTEMFLVEQSMIGQSKDSIFNIKTPLDHPEGKRKPGFGPKAFEKVVEYGIEKWLDDNELKERYNFNRSLMDFELIPDDIKESIQKEYDNYVYPNPDMILKFFKKYNWPEYIDNFTQVEDNFMRLY